MLIDTEKLRSAICMQYSMEADIADDMSDRRAMQYLTGIESRQAKDDEAIDRVEELVYRVCRAGLYVIPEE